MNIIIHIAQNKDFNAICKLMQNESGYPNLNIKEALKRLEFFQNSENHETFVAESNDKIVGFIGIMKDVAYNCDGYYAQIIALAVLEKAQGQGIGTTLLKQVEAWSLENRINNIGVNSGLQRLNTHKFYEKNGYEKKSYSFSKGL